MTGALPYRLIEHTDPPEIEWIWSDGAHYTEPFFEDTLARLRFANDANSPTRRPRTPLAALAATSPGLPVAGLIFHVSRCGSTLVTQMLARSPRNLVASEPPILDEILRLPDEAEAATGCDRMALLQGAARALAQPPAGGAERLIVKLSSWHLCSLPLLARAFPGVPLLFVYRSPLEVLVSLMRRPSPALVRDTLTPAQLGITATERDALTGEEHAAAVVGSFFRAAQESRTLLTPVAYENLPDAAVDVFPNDWCTAAERQELRHATAFDSKNPGQRFAPDTCGKRAEARPSLIAAAHRWCEPAYQRWLDTL